MRKTIFSLDGIARLVRGKQAPQGSRSRANPAPGKKFHGKQLTRDNDPLAGVGNDSAATRRDRASEADVLGWIEQAKSIGSEYPDANNIAAELRKATFASARVTERYTPQTHQPTARFQSALRCLRRKKTY